MTTSDKDTSHKPPGHGGPPAPAPGWHTPSPSQQPPTDDPPLDLADEAPISHDAETSEQAPGINVVRLQKVLAQAGVGSRRRCEELITEGAVSVNGKCVTQLPVWVEVGKDHITVNGKKVALPQSHVYIMLYKPRGIVSTTSDEDGRRCVADLVRHHARLYPVGRLDRDSSGLVLMTNDGELASLLTHPRHGVRKTYEVTVRGNIDQKSLAKIRKGVFLSAPQRSSAGGDSRAIKTQPANLRVLKQARDRTSLRIELREGRNRQIRRVLARLGYPVHRLKRTRIGPLTLKGLRPGQWRELDHQELQKLRKTAAARPASTGA